MAEEGEDKEDKESMQEDEKEKEKYEASAVALRPSSTASPQQWAPPCQLAASSDACVPRQPLLSAVDLLGLCSQALFPFLQVLDERLKLCTHYIAQILEHVRPCILCAHTQHTMC